MKPKCQFLREFTQLHLWRLKPVSVLLYIVLTHQQEQSLFVEINTEKAQPQGMNITIVTSAETDEASLELLTLLGMPFKKKGAANL